MKVVIHHGTCRRGGAIADQCLAATIRNPLGHERYCTAHIQGDRRTELTVVLIMDGQAPTLGLHTPVEPETAASESWLAFAAV